MEKHGDAEADQGRADNAILVQIMRMRKNKIITNTKALHET